MGGFSLVHWLLFGALVLVLFGKGRISDLMGDVAKGVRSFRKGLSDDDSAEAAAKNPDPAQRLGSNGQPIDVTPAAHSTHTPPRDHNLRL